MNTTNTQDPIRAALEHAETLMRFPGVGTGAVNLHATEIVNLLRTALQSAAAQPKGDAREAEFEVWLRTVCFQRPTPKAYDLAKCAWQAATAQASEPQPIDMVLFCPACGKQHIDAPKPRRALPLGDGYGTEVVIEAEWTNPPHRSHLCHGCGHIWRPADVPTNGVEAVKTKGKADSPIAAPARAVEPLTPEDVKELMGNIDTLIASVNEAHHAKSEDWKDGCFAAADRTYEKIKAKLMAHGITTTPAVKEQL